MSRVWCIILLFQSPKWFQQKACNFFLNYPSRKFGSCRQKLNIDVIIWVLKKVKTVPIKSMSKRPSQYLPDGLRKYVSPFGGGNCPSTADNPPVSEFELPKLKIAGKSHATAAGAKHAGNRQSSNATAATAIQGPEGSSFKRPSICSGCVSARYASERKSSNMRLGIEPSVQLRNLFFLVKFSVFQLESSSTKSW